MVISAPAGAVPDKVGVDDVGESTVGAEVGVALLPPPLPPPPPPPPLLTITVTPADWALSAALGAVDVTVKT